MKEKKLSLCYDPPIKFFMHHSIVLAMILAEDKNWNFVMSNYIQLNKSQKNNYIFDMYPRIGSAEIYGQYPLDHIMENHILSGDIMKINSRDMIDRVIGWIDSGYYVNVNSDERMLPNTSGYGSEFFHNHPGFYVGYDLEKRKMKMLNFDKEQNFKVIDVDFRDFIRSIESEDLKRSFKEKGFDSYLVQLRRLKQDVIDYNYTDSKTIVNIRRYLYEYLEGVDSSDKYRLSYETLENNAWGVEVYHVLIACLQGKYPTRFLFQCLCGLCEHKSLMVKRFHYLREQGCGMEEEIFTEYQKVSGFFERLKRIVLKKMLLKQELLFLEQIESLISMIDLEKKVLERVIKGIQ